MSRWRSGCLSQRLPSGGKKGAPGTRKSVTGAGVKLPCGRYAWPAPGAAQQAVSRGVHGKVSRWRSGCLSQRWKVERRALPGSGGLGRAAEGRGYLRPLRTRARHRSRRLRRAHAKPA